MGLGVLRPKYQAGAAAAWPHNASMFTCVVCCVWAAVQVGWQEEVVARWSDKIYLDRM